MLEYATDKTEGDSFDDPKRVNVFSFGIMELVIVSNSRVIGMKIVISC